MLIIFILLLVSLLLFTGCQNDPSKKFINAAKKYLKNHSIVCIPENMYYGSEEYAAEHLEIYLWHMEQAGKDADISIDPKITYHVAECNNFTLDNAIFNDHEYPYSDITIQVFFESEHCEEPLLSVIRVSSYFEGSYGTCYYPITVTADELRNEVYFEGY